MSAPIHLPNSRLGFHYHDDTVHYRAADLQVWLPELRALGAGWLTLPASLQRAVPEPFIAGLLGAGIQPVIHIQGHPIQPLDLAALRPLLETYARWGVSYVSIFDQPNLRDSWTPADWSRPGLLERFLDIFVPVAQAQVAAGLEPVFPGLQPGGDYWDTSFLEGVLDRLIAIGLRDLAASLTYAFYAWAYNRPPDWGSGGPRRWSDARPYLTPPDSQDNRGFHNFDWVSAVVREKLGAARPLLCLAGGAVPGDLTDPTLPPVNAERHLACNAAIASEAFSGELPDEVLNINFWLLTANEASLARYQAWYRTGESPLPVVNEVKHLARIHGRTTEAVTTGPRRLEKAIHHYVLLPVFEWGVSNWHLEAAKDYIRAFRPAVGFSVMEAAQASHVTIIGNEQAVGEGEVRTLQQQGCKVERITGPNGDAILHQLAELVRTGKPFKNGAPREA